MSDYGLNPLSDREVAIALFKAIGALAERLTGERLTIQVTSGSGHVFAIRSEPGIWERSSAAPAEPPDQEENP